MMSSPLVAGNLSDLARVEQRTTHRTSSYDRTGGNNDSVTSFAPGSTHVMLDANGPGRINHIWCTVASFPNHDTCLRDLVIRMYWENAEVPSVEVPLGDFFAMGHGRSYNVESAPICVGINRRAMNCYWPMPFRKHARIEIHNNGRRSLRRIYFNIDYDLGPVADNEALFHAEFRRDKALRTQRHGGNTTGADNYVILETEGKGQYVGCALFVDSQPGGWWGEGDDMIFIDHSELPVMIGTGSEDYFCNAWGYAEAFSYPFYGAPLLEELPDRSKLTTVYRWHIPDPVRFTRHIRVTIEHLFSDEVINDYSSVAYWYQTEPIRRRVPLPVAEDNHPRPHGGAERPPTFEMDATELEAESTRRGIAARSITANLSDGYKNGGWLRIEPAGMPVRLPIAVREEGAYHVVVKPVNALIERGFEIGLDGGEMMAVRKIEGHERHVPYIDLGTSGSRDGQLHLVVIGQEALGLDHLRVERVSP